VGGGVAGFSTSPDSMVIFGPPSCWVTGDEGREGPGMEDRFDVPKLIDVGREGALKGRESDRAGNSSEVI
jgi:hypothetical protein